MTLVERKDREAAQVLMSALVRRRRQLLTLEEAKFLIDLRELRLTDLELETPRGRAYRQGESQ